MPITIEIPDSIMSDFERRVKRLDPEKVEGAITRAAKRAATSAKAQTKRQIKTQYTAETGHVASTISTGSFGVGAYVWIQDSPSALPKFEGTNPNTPPRQKGIPVSARERQQINVENATGVHTMDRWFAAKMSSGHIGVFQRHSAGNIVERYGPSTVGMFRSDSVSEPVVEYTTDMFNKRLDHELGRLLEQ